jgi:hypothetical protein
MFHKAQPRNLSAPKVRSLKKIIGLALLSLQSLPSTRAVRFARCCLLRTAQWAIDGRRDPKKSEAFRVKLRTTVHEMLASNEELGGTLDSLEHGWQEPCIICDSSERLSTYLPFASGDLVDLVVTSPPYAGIHALYHRWQVGGRRETPAPYWIGNCPDGSGAAFYTFGDRHASSFNYMSVSLRTLTEIRKVCREGAVIVQLISFSRPRSLLPRYLENMRAAGFDELTATKTRTIRRLWRPVPGRKWHATMKGPEPAAREVVLVHQAV